MRSHRESELPGSGTDVHDDVVGSKAELLKNLDLLECARILDRVIPSHVDGVEVFPTSR